MSVKKLGIAAAAAMFAVGLSGAANAADILDQVLPLDGAGLGDIQAGIGLPDESAIPSGDAMFEDVNDRVAAGRERLMSRLADASAAVAAEGGNDKVEAYLAVMPLVYDAIGPALVGGLQQGAEGASQGVGASLGAIGDALNLSPGLGQGGGF